MINYLYASTTSFDLTATTATKLKIATLTVRLPDDKYERLKALALSRKISINKLMEELSTKVLAEFDSKVRFRALASAGKTKKGLKILDILDAHFEG